MRCSASSKRIISSPILARASVSSRSSGSLRVLSPRVPCSRKIRFQLSSSWAGTWLSRETASSASPRRSRKTSSVLRCTLQRSGRSTTSAGGGSLPGVVVGFRALSFMPGLLGCRHRSPDGVQRNRVRFSCMSSIFATSYTGFWIFGQAIHGSIGYTGYWLSEGHIYGPRGYTECWIDDEQHISSNTYGYIGWLYDNYIYGQAERM